jgi:hypothetical protein
MRTIVNALQLRLQFPDACIMRRVLRSILVPIDNRGATSVRNVLVYKLFNLRDDLAVGGFWNICQLCVAP